MEASFGHYWDRFANTIVGQWANRLTEQNGLRDIYDELARFDDDGMSVSGFLKNTRAATWGAVTQTLDMPLQTLVNMAPEANRLGGALVLAAPRHLGDTDYQAPSLQPFRNYLTGGLTPDQQKDLYSRSAPGIYRPLSFGDLVAVTSDHLLNEGLNDNARYLATFGLGYSSGGGSYANGSYLPNAWDMRAVDAGEQLDNSGILASQRLAANLATYVIFDPLNFMIGPAGTLIRAGKGYRLVQGAEARISEGLMERGANLTGELELSKADRRLMGQRAPWGLLNQGRMAQALNGGKFDPMIKFIRETGDVDKLTEYFVRTGMASDWSGAEGARLLARMAARTRTDQDVLHFLNAYAFRNVESIRVMDNLITDAPLLQAEFKAATGIGDDIFDQAMVDFVAGEQIPVGHILHTNAKSLLDEALAANPQAKARWDALSAGKQAEGESVIAGRRYAMEAQQRLLEKQNPIDAVTGERVIEESVRGSGVQFPISTLPRAGKAKRVAEDVNAQARRIEEARAAGKPASWLDTRTNYIKIMNGPTMSRFRPKIFLMDKPGLTFNLHSEDAIEKFNDMIRWTDGYIGTGVRDRSSTLADDYRFASDPEVIALHDRFVDAGVMAREPQAERAKLVNDLQSLVLKRIAMHNGIEESTGMMLAARGMEKGEQLANALNDAQFGYLAALRGDDGINILTHGAAVERQAPNFIPLMDWEAAGRAMRSIGASRPATAPGELVSEVTVTEMIGQGGKYAKRPLKYIGSEEAAIPIRRATHLMVDLADAANYVFKSSVLLRLGYTTRNLSEGALSAFAAGVPLLEIMKFARFDLLVADALYNAHNIPNRMVDTTTTFFGLRMNDEGLLRFAEAKGMYLEQKVDRVRQLIAIAASPETEASLLKIIANKKAKFTPEEVAEARESLRYIIEQRRRLHLAVTDENLAQMGPFRPVSSAQASQHLYHADTGGLLDADKVWDAEGVLGLTHELDRPIRLTDNLGLAHGNVDRQWNHLPVGTNTQAQRVAALEQQRIAAGATHYGYVTRKGKQRYTVNVQTALRSGDPARITVLNVGPNGKPILGLAPNWQPRLNMVAANLHNFLPGVHGAVPEFAAIYTPGVGLKAGIGEVEVDAAITGLFNYRGTFAPHGVIPPNASQSTRDIIDALDTAWLDLKNLRFQGGTAVNVPLADARTVGNSMMGSHHVQMRDNPNAAWVPFREAGLLTTSEVRVLDRASHPTTFPKTVSVDTWGAEIDLRTAADVQRLVNENYDLDWALVEGARRGEEAAINRLSEVFAGKGIYRMVLPDSQTAGWGRYQVVAHPKAVGPAGYQRAVQQEFDEAVAGAHGPFGTPIDVHTSIGGKHVWSVEGMNPRQVNLINRHIADDAKRRQETVSLIGQPMDPLDKMKAVDVVRKGGFEAYADEVINDVLRARGDMHAAQHLYQQRMKHVQKIAKRKGLSQHETANMFRMASSYGQANNYIQASLLNGIDGAVYGSLADSAATHLSGMMSEGYMADGVNDIRRSMMTPRALAATDPRYFDALSNLFNRQFRDAQAAAVGTDNLDPVVARLLGAGDRDTVVAETIHWAQNTTEGQQWVRTLGLRVANPQTVEAEFKAAEAGAKLREPRVPAKTREERRTPRKVNWRGTQEDIYVGDVALGDVVSTMSNFIENYVLPSPLMREALRDGRPLTGEMLRAAHQEEPWELLPVSGLLQPTTAESRAILRQQRENTYGMDKVNHVITRGLSKALTTLGAVPETRLLRHPMFEAVGQVDMRQRIAMAERNLGRPLNLEELNVVRTQAQKFALKTVSRTLYTLSGRSMMDDWLRFVIPFFPAWRNTVTRWGRFAMNNPARVGLVASRPSSVGRTYLNVVDENGQPVEFEDGKADSQYAIMPGIGGVIEKVFGVEGASEMMGKTYISMRSLDVIFQGDILNPGIGPWVTVPMQWVLSDYPEWNEGVVKQLAEYAMPVGPVHGNTAENVWGQFENAGLAFLPTGVRRMVDQFTNSRAYAAETTKAQYLLLQQQANGEYQPDSPLQLVKDARKIAEWKMTVRVLSAFVSPFAAQQRGEVETYAAYYRQFRETLGSSDLADEQFSKLFPDQYILKLSSSKNPTGGAATSRGVRNQKEFGALQQLAVNAGDLSLLSWAMNFDDSTRSSHAYEEGEYNPFAAIWQETNKPEGSGEAFRSKFTPEEAGHEAQIQKGWNDYRKMRDEIGLNLLGKGLAPGSYEYEKQMEDQVAVGADFIAEQNEPWRYDRGVTDSTRLVRNENFFKELLNDERYGFINAERREYPGIKAMQRYLALRDEIRKAIQRRNIAGERITTTDSVAGFELAVSLAAMRASLRQDSPDFSEWVDRWFQNDFVNIENSTGFVEEALT